LFSLLSSGGGGLGVRTKERLMRGSEKLKKLWLRAMDDGYV
jgi:hypothetical protein